MIRSLAPVAAVLALLAGCQSAAPPKETATPQGKTEDMLIGTWTPNSNGYQDGVFRSSKSIITACTEYKKDGTYESTQQYVNADLAYVYTEEGTWTYNGSFLAMKPAKKNRKVTAGSIEGEPKLSGETFQLEVIELTHDSMLRRAGEERHLFRKTAKPRPYTIADLPKKEDKSAPKTTA